MDRTITGAEGRPALVAELTGNGRAVLGYWESLRGPRALPLRADFDPFAIPRQLPGVQLVEVLAAGAPVAAGAVPDAALEFVYRVVGTRETAARGRNPTGRQIEQGFFGGSAERVRRNYLQVFRTAAPLLDLEEVETPGGFFVQDVSLFLPLARDAAAPEVVAQILVYSEQLAMRQDALDRRA